LAANITGKDFMDEVDVIACAELVELFPRDLEMPI